jgi:perosamine synthetase
MDPIINKNAKKYIQVAKPTLEQEEIDAVKQVVQDGWVSRGPKVKEFEQLIANAHNKKFGSSCNSGATALILALVAADVKAGDEVIVPDLTMIAVANAVLAIGAIPVFADSDVQSGVGNVSKITLNQCITPKTKAAIIVHTYGEPIEYTQDIVNFLHHKHIRVIEDCAESHYARDNNGNVVGSCGDLSIFSFYSNKIITTGEGGMVLTDNLDVKDRLDRIQMHAFTPGKHFWHTEHAWGVRMTDMQAAIGIEQHKKKDRFIIRRKEIRGIYEENITNSSILVPTTPGSTNWVMPILVNERQKFREHLAENGVDHRTYFNPFSQQVFLTKYVTHDNPIARLLSETGLYLPLYPTLTDDDVLYICEVINKYNDKT